MARKVVNKPMVAINRLESLLNERERRQMEMLRIFRPLPYQLPIFTSTTPELVVRGGNRSGKTTATSVLFASLATGQPIIGPLGKIIDSPWPKSWSKSNLLLWVVGYDERHIGQTIHRHLFKPGLFRVIRDLESGEYRTFRPWDPVDMERAEEALDSEPLIPERFVKQWAWKDFARNVFETCELVNGTTICAFSSRGEPKQGDKVHCIWIDEDIEYESHIAEFRMRLLDYSGRLLWSAFPHSKNQALIEMSEQAEDQKKWDEPIVEEIKVSMLDNPYISDKQKSRAGISLSDELEQRSRIHGDFTFDSYLVYPSYSKRLHTFPSENKEHFDEIDSILAKNVRPRNWTRFISVDPGFVRAAILFAAVPPVDMFDNLPEDERYLVIEDEIYTKGKTVNELAKEIRLRTEGFVYQSFIIDWHAARQTPMTGGRTIYQQFQEQFIKNQISSEETGSGFRKGNDDISGRIMLVRKYLELNRLGKPRLRLNREKTAGLQLEFVRYKFRTAKQGFIDETPVKRFDHALDALGYLVSINPEYVENDYNRIKSPAFTAYQKIMDRQKQKQMSGRRFVHLGPGTGS